MILDKNWKFPLFFFFFNKISLEIKSYDHLVIKQAPPTPRPPQPKKVDFT